jgi:YVTN family beta-propeller protein
VADRDSDTVSVIATATNTVVATIGVGLEPFDVAIKPGGAFAYVTNLGSNTVSVIDTSTNTVSATVPVGNTPHDVAITPLVIPGQQLENACDDLQDIVDNNPGTPLADKVEDALGKCQTAKDELAKEPPDNQAVVGNIEGVVGDLEAAVKDELLDAEQGMQLMDQLAGIARLLAVDAIDQANADPQSDPDSISEAEQYLADGDLLVEYEAFKDAVNKYKDALSKAESALP